MIKHFLKYLVGLVIIMLWVSGCDGIIEPGVPVKKYSIVKLVKVKLAHDLPEDNFYTKETLEAISFYGYFEKYYDNNIEFVGSSISFESNNKLDHNKTSVEMHKSIVFHDNLPVEKAAFYIFSYEQHTVWTQIGQSSGGNAIRNIGLMTPVKFYISYLIETESAEITVGHLIYEFELLEYK